MKKILTVLLGTTVLLTTVGCTDDTKLVSTESDLVCGSNTTEVDGVCTIDSDYNSGHENTPEVTPVTKSDDELVIIHTNDFHGRYVDDEWAGAMGLASVAGVANQIRSEYEHTLMLDSGDSFHGTTFATLDEGESYLNVMNQMGYDVFAPGNHDFNYGLDRLLELEEKADFDFVANNAYYTGTNDASKDGEKIFDEYVIKEVGGLEVGIFGIASPETAFKTHPNNVVNVDFRDPVSEAQKSVTALEAEGVDLIISLAHIGLDDATDVTSEDIANQVDGIDLIVDGHSHHTLTEGKQVNDTLIVQAGEYTGNVGKVTIDLEDLSINAGLITRDDVIAEDSIYTPDAKIEGFIEGVEAGQRPILDEVIGSTNVDLDGARESVRVGETNLGNLITDAMVDQSSATIAIQNGGGIRESIQTGDITKGDVITVLPFGNFVVTKELTGSEIIEVITHGVSGYGYTDGTLNSLATMPHVSGINYTVTYVDSSAGPTIEVFIGDSTTPIDADTVYTVATNDFLAAGGDDYPVFNDKEVEGNYDALDEVLIKYIQSLGAPVDSTTTTTGRINFIGFIK